MGPFAHGQRNPSLANSVHILLGTQSNLLALYVRGKYGKFLRRDYRQGDEPVEKDEGETEAIALLDSMYVDSNGLSTYR